MSTLLALGRMVSWSVDLGARAVDECAVPELQHEQHPDLVREVRLPTSMSRPERLHACGIEIAALASPARADRVLDVPGQIDRKSTRLNSSHITISYAVFCLKKKILYRMR